MNILRIINNAVSVLFAACYFYQFVYIIVAWFKKNVPHKKTVVSHSYAVLVCARNESRVIGELLDSIANQTYDQRLIKVFVIADNCTDDTADVARRHGAVVYERHNDTEIGKGYALREIRRHINADYPDGFDAYLVFDADNILSVDYIEEMNKTFSDGYDIITSYRNSKNFGDNWISAGYALWFLRESRYLNGARFKLGTSCAVSGTGFLFSRKVADEIEDWPYHLLIEDIQFSIDKILSGYKIAFCPKAELYDEQPTKFSQSWRQRVRWTKGYLQVCGAYGKGLVKGMFRGDFSCFDMTMNILPAFILSTVSVILNTVLVVLGFLMHEDLTVALISVVKLLNTMFSAAFIVGFITTLTEWKHIQTKVWKKIAYTITFPIFMITYIPISIAAFFAKPEWKPIEHSVSGRDVMNKMSNSD